MPTYAENLATLQAQVTQRLVDITASPQVSYTDQGRTFSFTEYQAMLFGQLKQLEELMQDADGPILVRSRGS